AARVQGVPLPYEGLLLMLMFGYFAMGLPFVSASLASALIILGYGMTAGGPALRPDSHFQIKPGTATEILLSHFCRILLVMLISCYFEVFR
ncbi:MAG TPA: hypothetical protein VFN01_15215, partial [Marinobacter sp.]|nr:hypothetical protein [Marinobacter sp.]